MKRSVMLIGKFELNLSNETNLGVFGVVIFFNAALKDTLRAKDSCV